MKRRNEVEMSEKMIVVNGIKYVLYGWNEDTTSGKNEPHIAEAKTGKIPLGQQRKLLKEWLVANNVNIEPWSEKTTHWCVLEALKLNSIVSNITASTARSIDSIPHYLELTAENIEAQSTLVLNSLNYGEEAKIIHATLTSYPKNDDLNIVATKIALIDVTNSTQLSRQKSKISLFDLAHVIISIENIDDRIAQGDPEVVNLIAKNTGSLNLFSFASKYCTYHNVEIYGRDDYSIYDSIVKKYLPYYANNTTKSAIEKWRKSIDYASFNDCIGNVLNEYGIDIPFKRRKFDRFLWYPNRQKI